MSPEKKKSPLENRLKRLEKEAKTIRSDMKVLSRAIQKPENLSNIPHLKTGRAEAARRAPPPRREPGPIEAEPVIPSSAEMPPEASHGDLFSWTPPATGEAPPRQIPGRPEPTDTAHEGAAGEKNRSHVSRDDRFRNYFGHGSFMPARPLKQERRLQRNKAIFMLVVVIVFGFIVLRLFF